MTKSIKIGGQNKSIKIGLVGPKPQMVRVIRLKTSSGRKMSQIGLWRFSVLIAK